ncbi:MAG: efflux RND transporter periplasmic adaptor subunit [Nitrospirae bacterium]|nr:efflux RND transporter periplasmic adaptor subunit [Nitrospirota bacterium]MBU6479395.1 efflux RND transporter periplasmic adaptor subunit [Nitrospirota bacterium]MDE3218220.1 efflux RND transporter periplasmic adaptor subunit [Nitrospirota bacterium]
MNVVTRQGEGLLMRRLVLAMAMAAFLTACNSREEPVQPARTSTPIASIQAVVTEVQTVQVPLRVEVTGQITAVAQATLSSHVQSTVEELRVREGTAVKKGQTLVVLDSRDLRAELARAQAEAENARAHLARMKQLYGKDAVSTQEKENADRTFKVAEASRRAALTKVSHTIVTAPFDGVITEKKIEVGEIASPGQPLLKMEDPQRLRLEATVAEGDLQALSRGETIPVVVDALGPKPLSGTVAQILPTGDPATHTFLVKVELSPTPGLKTGMFGRMLVEKGTGQTLVVPRSAVIERGELTGLYVVGPDSSARLRWVKLGRRLGESTEILSGVTAGERLLADASTGIEGARIENVPR